MKAPKNLIESVDINFSVCYKWSLSNETAQVIILVLLYGGEA